jgi:nicotinamide-nucleotide amidase
MKAEIIGVGTELLMGQIANTDAQFLSQQLSELGIDVYYHHVVGDNINRLVELIKKIKQRSDIIITTGGLGPTQDDLTKDGVAQAFGLEMIKDEASENKLNTFFKSIHRDITINNYRQAYFPEGSIILKNDRGTAPGCILERDDTTVIVLPGPPRELNHMFLNEVKPYLLMKSGFIIKSNLLKVFGVGESELEHRLMDFIENQANPTLATYASAGEVSLRVTAKAKSAQEADELLKPVVSSIVNHIGDSVYSINGENMPQVVYKLLKEQDKKVAFAESCTGGMLSSMIVDIPGSSAVLDMSVISYSNESKIETLHVKKETLDTYGAVSEETVIEMAEGLLDISRACITVAISGIAGPDGGSDDKPVGLIYVCLNDGNKHYIRKLNFARERNYNRTYACLHALDMLRRYLTKCL